jgi:hypothetical protein
MRAFVVSLLASLVATTSAAALERRQNIHVIPPVAMHPLPQGTPYLTDGFPSHAPTELRYGFVDGKRVLFDPYSGVVVYVLRP